MAKKPASFLAVAGLAITVLALVVGWSVAYAQSKSELEKRLVQAESNCAEQVRNATDHKADSTARFAQIDAKWDIVENRLDAIQIQVAEVKVIVDRMEKMFATKMNADTKTQTGIPQPVSSISQGPPLPRQ